MILSTQALEPDHEDSKWRAFEIEVYLESGEVIVYRHLKTLGVKEGEEEIPLTFFVKGFKGSEKAPEKGGRGGWTTGKRVSSQSLLREVFISASFLYLPSGEGSGSPMNGEVLDHY